MCMQHTATSRNVYTSYMFTDAFLSTQHAVLTGILTSLLLPVTYQPFQVLFQLTPKSPGEAL